MILIRENPRQSAAKEVSEWLFKKLVFSVVD